MKRSSINGMNLHARVVFASLATLVAMAFVGSESFADGPIDKVKQAALRANIVKFAQSKLGTKVDLGQGGECTELIDAALKQYGGKPIFYRKTMVFDKGTPGWFPTYGWGGMVLSTKSKVPPGTTAGHIIQFEKCKFESTNRKWDFPHHTAIVESVNGTNITLLHQNVDGGVKNGFPSEVRRQTIDFATKINGGFTVWNPIPQ